MALRGSAWLCARGGLPANEEGASHAAQKRPSDPCPAGQTLVYIFLHIFAFGHSARCTSRPTSRLGRIISIQRGTGTSFPRFVPCPTRNFWSTSLSKQRSSFPFQCPRAISLHANDYPHIIVAHSLDSGLDPAATPGGAVPAILCSPRPKIVLLLLLVAARGTWDGRHPQEAESRVIGGVDQFGSPSAIHSASRFS